jgi:hypothetical protein
MTPIRLLSVLSLAAAVASGCAPMREDQPPGAVGSGEMAVLSSDGGGYYDVQVLDMSGNLQYTVDSNLAQPVGIAHHPDGFFVVNDMSTLYRVDNNGESSVFNNQPIPGVVYRAFVSEDDGTTTTADEYETTVIDPEGEVVDVISSGGQYCWMDAGLGSVNGTTAVLDVFGPTVALVDTTELTIEPIATAAGVSANILGMDGAGDHWLASNWDTRLYPIRDGQVGTAINLSQHGVYAVKAVEPGPGESVIVLADDSQGSLIAEVSIDGEMREILRSEGTTWMDLAIY